jgi:hypothetical protein
MNKTLSRRSTQQAKQRKSVPKLKKIKCKTAAGRSYTASYPVPKPHKAYRPNEASQFGVPEVSIGSLNFVGMGWS